MRFCKWCKQKIFFEYQRGIWIAFDDMCFWNIHRCKKRESE